MITAGSDDALEYTIKKHVYTKTRVFIFVPSYDYFEIVVRRYTYLIHYIPLDFNINEPFDIDECLAFYKDILENSVVYIINPNNSLGALCNNESIKRVVSTCTRTLFIVDEANIEFCLNQTSIKYIDEYKNSIVTRTFSKAHGLAGIRLGYVCLGEKNDHFGRHFNRC